jgi:hypothetical protein
MTVKKYAIVNGDKLYNRILIEDSEVENYVYWEDPEAILIEDEDDKYAFVEPEWIKNAKPVVEDPFANLTLEQKQQIAAILGIGSSETTTTVDNPA